jgi:hypothetical protein
VVSWQNLVIHIADSTLQYQEAFKASTVIPIRGANVVVVKSREQLYELVQRGYKPYFHKAVKRWYLRKGQERLLINRSLEAEAEALARSVVPQRSVPENVAKTVGMGTGGLPVRAKTEGRDDGMTTSYKKIDSYGEAVAVIERVERELGVPLRAGQTKPPPPPPQVPPQAPSMHNPLDGVIRWLSSLGAGAMRVLDRAAENPQIAEDLADIVVSAAAGACLAGLVIIALAAGRDEERVRAARAFKALAEQYKKHLGTRTED